MAEELKKPFVSRAQRKWMYSQKPEMAAEWEEHTPKGKKLPEHVKKSESNFTLKHGKGLPDKAYIPDTHHEAKEAAHAHHVTIHNKQDAAVGHLAYVNHPKRDYIYPLEHHVAAKHKNAGLTHKMIAHAEKVSGKPMKSSGGKIPYETNQKNELEYRIKFIKSLLSKLK